MFRRSSPQHRNNIFEDPPSTNGSHEKNIMASDDKGSSSRSSSPLLDVKDGSGHSPSATADKKSKDSSSSMGSFKLLLLIMMVLQNSSTVLVGRYTRAGVPEEELYEVNHLIVVIELSKLLLAAGLEFYTTGGRLWESCQVHILARPLDALKILVPALLYLVQNTLLYVALSNLTAPLFQVTYQAKLVTTAIVSVLMLNRKYSVQQWICLVVLSVGVAIVVLGEQKEDDEKKEQNQNLVTGLTAVSIACFSSALAGVYFEKVLKKKAAPASGEGGASSEQPPPPPPASLWMRNIQLAFFSVVIALCQGLSKPSTGQPYLHGFSVWAWILVALQAGGGLLVAAVIKYADNVLKGLATGVSVVFATFLSMVFFQTPLKGQFAVGATMILASVYLFSNPLPNFQSSEGPSGARKKKDTELKTLLPK